MYTAVSIGPFKAKSDTVISNIAHQNPHGGDGCGACYTSGQLSTSSDLFVYGDSIHVMTAIPTFLNGVSFIRTAYTKGALRTDLAATLVDNENNPEYLCFDIDIESTVYILYDSRADSLPDWLSATYTDRNERATAYRAACNDCDVGNGYGGQTAEEYVPFDIYYAFMPAGRVCMGGDEMETSNLNYFVAVGPASQAGAGVPCSRVLAAPVRV